MATQSPIQKQSETPETVDAGRRSRLFGRRRDAAPRPPLGEVLRELNWRLLLLVGIASGISWTLLLSQQSALTFFAGLLPVTGGILVGRRVTGHINWHAGVLSAITIVAALATTLLLALIGAASADFLRQVVFLGIIALLPFPAFGAITSHRTEERNRQMRLERDRRGGKLERPGRVKSIEELRSLSLPQLGSYVSDLFRKHDFKVEDYQFERDNFLEFAMRHDGEPWIVRVTVDDKVKQGIALQFWQRLRAEGQARAVLITSMSFQEQATRWAKDKPIALIDGETLLSMDD